LLDGGANGCDVDRLARVDRQPQCVLHRVLAFAGCNRQDFQIFTGSDLRTVSCNKQVVSHAKMAGRKHVFAILVVFECTRLTQQRIDHMAIVDRGSTDARQPGHPLNQVAMVRDIDPFGMDGDIDFLADQPTWNGVAIATNLDRTATANTNAAKRFVASDLVIRQRSKLLLFDGESIGPCQISFGDHLFDKGHVVVAAFEVTAAAEQQSLIDRVLDVAVQGFDVAVLVGTPSVGVLRSGAVVLHQGLIP
jgi:hypothetical protein